MAWVYILRCGDNTFYVGHCEDLEARVDWHRAGLGARHTALKLPIDLVYKEQLASKQSAIDRERQLKRWSAEKKAALVSGDLTKLKQLAKRRRRGKNAIGRSAL